uniref:MATE efflux family protein 4ic-like n=1 Tax=Rhizophora mucronata TaxID=61149 RepID=A0A2P2MUV7_RHIMU
MLFSKCCIPDGSFPLRQFLEFPGLSMHVKFLLCFLLASL